MVLLLLHHGAELRLVRLHAAGVLPMLIVHHFVLIVAIMMLSAHAGAITMATEGRPTFIEASHRWSSPSLHVAAGVVVTLRATIAASSTLISKLTSSVALVFLTEGHATLIK